jgi:hypothetical protein
MIAADGSKRGDRSGAFGAAKFAARLERATGRQRRELRIRTGNGRQRAALESW